MRVVAACGAVAFTIALAAVTLSGGAVRADEGSASGSGDRIDLIVSVDRGGDAGVVHHHGAPNQPPPPMLRLVTELRVNPVTGRPCAFSYNAPGLSDPSDETLAIKLVSQYGPCPG